MLLSINPEYVESIFDGSKIYEYRKTRCREDVDKIIIYATAPQKQVVGEAEIDEILEDDVLSIWSQTKEYSGITYNFFRSYYKGKKKAIAYRLRNLIIYDEPRSLAYYGVSCAPQSYRYLPGYRQDLCAN
jgi:Uncharacterized conserved protein